MRSRTLLVVLCLFGAVNLYAAGPKAVAAHTFACTSSQLPTTCPNGGYPTTLIQGSDGNFYGVALFTTSDQGGIVYSLTPAGAYHIIYEFLPGKKGDYPDGSKPGNLAEGPDGALYGSTGTGGAHGQGTLFRLNTDGSGFQVLRSLCNDCDADQIGAGPWVLAGDGNFYGVAGGAYTCFHHVLCGAIYRIIPATGASEFVFDFKTPSEYLPSTPIVGPDGTLYGTLESDGTEPLLYHYDEVAGTLQTSVLNVPTGGPYAGAYGLTIGPNGNFYGLYDYYDGNYLYATGLFEVQLNGSNLQVFPLIPNSGGAYAVVFGADGNIWMAQQGHGKVTTPHFGDVLEVSPQGSLIQTLKIFDPSSAFGGYPIGLISGADGKLWGVSAQFGHAPAGLVGGGVVFNITP
jgi:uncharacterized repeat protein (TIGR03803 family)